MVGAIFMPLDPGVAGRDRSTQPRGAVAGSRLARTLGCTTSVVPFMDLGRMTPRSTRQMREAAPDAPGTPRLSARDLNGLLASASANQLADLIAHANRALPDDDDRKIREDDVRMLRRLASQARTCNRSLLDHAAERRLAGERRGRVSPEADKTAQWAERLATALETVTSRRATGAHATPGRNEFLADQGRNFRDIDGRTWHVRIEQGGGRPDVIAESAPVPVLILGAMGTDASVELSIAGDVGQWDLASYSDDRLRSLLAEAQAHAAESRAE